MKSYLFPCVVLLLTPLQLEAQPSVDVIKILLNDGSGDLSALPWAALLPDQQLDNFPYSSRWGYPLNFRGGNTERNWPVETSIGDVDQDGNLDLLMVMEQRLVMAIGFQWSEGRPSGAYLIWAWFDPSGPINKRNWGHDSGVVLWDVNPEAGDGLNEVAVVLRDAASGRLALTLLGGPLSPDPNFGGELRPSILSSHQLNSPCNSGWEGQILGQGWQVNVDRVNVRGGAEPRDIMVTDNQAGQPHIFTVGPGPTLELLFCEGWHSQQGHVVHAFDVDLDGKDEILFNGVVQFNIPPTGSPPFRADPCETWKYCFIPWNHADTVIPLDHNNDGQPEILIVHDDFDMLFDALPTGCNSTCGPSFAKGEYRQIWTFDDALSAHGQTLGAGELVPGKDVFGYEGKEYFATPKGAPFYNGGGPWGSYAANGQPRTLAMNLVSGLPPNGPTGWSPRNVDWDGDRTQDEVFNYFSGYHSLFRLVPNPSGPHPYAWEGIVHFQDTIWNGFSESQVTDLYGDSREEIVILGRLGIEIVSNTAANPLAGKYQSPWLSPGYARRFSGPVSRPVDYQSMAQLVQLEVRPTTEGAVPGGDPIPYQAIGHYSDGSTADLTSVATWTSGDASVAAFSGNVLAPLNDGYASIQANVAGVTNDDAALAYVSADSRPVIFYAGYADTYLTSSTGGDLVIEARVADPQNDVSIVVLFINGVALPGLPFNDSGISADRISGDGVWTMGLPAIGPGIPPQDLYLQVVALDSAGVISDMWPYLSIGTGPLPSTPGFPLLPFASETISSPPPVVLAGTGLANTRVVVGDDPATVTFMARATGNRPVHAVDVWLWGSPFPVGMNDLGQGADQIAADGLWTASLTVGASAVIPGVHLFEFLAQRAAVEGEVQAWSDAYPRLRVHE